MTQSNVDQDYINNIYQMIESLEGSFLEKQEERDYDSDFGHLQEPYDAKIGSEVMGRRKGYGGQFNEAPDYSRHRQGAPEGRKVPQQQGMMTAADEDELPEADHWCPDVQAWHTADHEPANPPQVHINVSNNNGEDPYASENGVEKGSILGEGLKIGELAQKGAGSEKIANIIGGAGKGAVEGAMGGALEGAIEGATVEKQTKTVQRQGDTTPDEEEMEGTSKEYDQNTNLPSVSQEVSEDSIAAPFLR